MYTLLESLSSSAKWFKLRNGYLNCARETRETLTDPNGYWRYTPDDKRVREAVNAWVKRARNAHAIAMGRKPVISKLVVNGAVTSLYAEERGAA